MARWAEYHRQTPNITLEFATGAAAHILLRMQRHPLIIMAAGVSSRMKKAFETGDTGIDPVLIHEANTLPKCMLSVGPQRTRFIDFILANTVSAGFQEIILILHPGDEVTGAHVINTLALLSPETVLSIVRQIIPEGRVKPHGTGDAIHQAVSLSALEEDDLYSVTNADNLCSQEAFTRAYSADTNTIFPYATASLGISPEARSKYGLVLCDTLQGKMVAMYEKPNTAEILELEIQGELTVNMNLYTLRVADTKDLLAGLTPHPVRDEKELNDVINALASEGNMRAEIISEALPDLTSKSDIPLVRAYLASNYSGVVHLLT